MGAAIIVFVVNEKHEVVAVEQKDFVTLNFLESLRVLFRGRFIIYSFLFILPVEEFEQEHLNLRSLVLQYHFYIFCDIHQEMF